MNEPSSGSETPALATAREARAAQAARLAAGETALLPPLPPAIPDPLRFCVWTTVALLAWLLSPALVAAAFGFAGLVAYARAWRAGLRRSDCILGDPRLVMLYLAMVGVSGVGWTAWRLIAWFTH
ncbi:MAG TPA: hypothetical protein VFE33_24360 [Thermoanaerobaculia bacterium]|nr:hypothetical protein [Thermoanaerobaculia bacterium]